MKLILACMLLIFSLTAFAKDNVFSPIPIAVGTGEIIDGKPLNVSLKPLDDYPGVAFDITCIISASANDTDIKFDTIPDYPDFSFYLDGKFLTFLDSAHMNKGNHTVVASSAFQRNSNSEQMLVFTNIHSAKAVLKSCNAKPH